ncbi:MAG: hypothetical protein L3J91_00635 [Thermoplasmata archaeon]|nr:hypothetical protein [Thermoplasmata archaeon]
MGAPPEEPEGGALYGVEGGEAPIDEEPTTAPRRRYRRRRALPIVAVLGIALVLLLPLLLNLGWAPVVHWTCAPGNVLAKETYYAPGVIGEAPYGGDVWANGTFPWNPEPFAGAGGNESNGGSFADLSTALFSIYPATNQTAWGPGPNDRCNSPYIVTVGPSASIGLKLLGLLPEGTVSDANAPLQVPAMAANDTASVVMGDRYLANNVEPIDTCNLTQPVERTVSTSAVTIGLPAYLPNNNLTLSITLGVSATFTYWFPAGYGVWIVDDLSQNGYLPGAGWAFAYHACA